MSTSDSGGGESRLRIRVSELEERVSSLEQELARCEKVKRVLMDRVERSVGEQESSYALFERNILLQKYVEERTSELAALNEKLRAEIVQRQFIEHELEWSRDAALSSQRQALLATKAKSQFLANMSHEIRTPLNAIIGMVQLTLRTSLDSKQRHFAQTILDSAQSLLGILNDILDLSKVEAGKMEFESIEFELSTVLANLGNLAAIKAESKGIDLFCAVDPEVPERLVGDPLRLGQVLLNLCNNAIKFTERGEVVVRVEQDVRSERNATLRFSVTDTGIGIAEEHRSRLFQMFTQADASTTRRFGGTGLGLAICRDLVEMMGGEIGIESVLGRGSCFHFCLPFELPPQDAQAAQAPPAMGGDRRVLVVSTSATGRQLLGDIVRGFGLRCEAADSAEAALECVASAAVQGDPFLVLFIEHRAHGSDGLELVEALRREVAPGRWPAIFIVTGHGQDEVRFRAQELGIDGFLTRPFNRSTVFDALVIAFGGAAPVPRSLDSTDREVSVVRARAFLSHFTVLLAEDNPINTQIASAFLSDLGVKILAARDGVEAVALVMSHPEIALVLMDIQMPRRDGLEATRIIRGDSRFAELPIVAMTAHAMTADAEKSRDVGMNGHLVKPVDPDRLRRELVTLLSGRYPELWLAAGEVSGASAAAGAIVAPDSREALDPALPSISGLDAEAGAALAQGRDIYLEMLEAFVEDGGRHEQGVRDALREGDQRALQRAAHSLRGVGGYLCAQELVERAALVEQGFRQGRACAAMDEVPLLLDELCRLLDEVRKWKGAQAGPGGDPHEHGGEA